MGEYASIVSYIRKLNTRILSLQMGGDQKELKQGENFCKKI